MYPSMAETATESDQVGIRGFQKATMGLLVEISLNMEALCHTN